MLFLLLYLDSDCYALDVSQVVEILPFVSVKKMLRSPQGVVGTINYHGTFVPIIDFSEMVLGRRAPTRLSTRILLLRCRGQDGLPCLVGLVAERATETMRCEAADFVSAGITNIAAPYLGGIASTPRGLVQRIELENFLPKVLGDLVIEQPGSSR
jgi:chemotaxis-related protein WspB